ncbi:hypothetical protein BJP36_38660 [Moorena producens JHB]|uniref:Uncharacterized protein n=1 Tax=Moorena producens (strain JHB) TaxID=1454205 RepID=A0A9Q9UWK7_MOOP1|nr:hypothetical protein [Moorena producens]WAN69995.1 hypothetical protein BJP36_38660 [Moorena producens JHB]
MGETPMTWLNRYFINSCLLPLASCLSKAGVCSQFKYKCYIIVTVQGSLIACRA